jgi:hypothetical protein
MGNNKSLIILVSLSLPAIFILIFYLIFSGSGEKQKNINMNQANNMNSTKSVSQIKNSGQIQVSLSLRSIETGSGESKKTVQVKMKNVSNSKLDDIKVVSVTINFNPGLAGKFSLVDSDIVCNSFFTSKMPSSIKNDSVYLTCANLGSSLSLKSEEEKEIAVLNFNTLSNVQGSVNLNLGSVVIPDHLLNNLGVSAY